MWSVARVNDSESVDDANVDSILQGPEQSTDNQEQQESEEKRIQVMFTYSFNNNNISEAH